MVTTQRFRAIDPATGALDPRIFTDQAIYDAEMEQIFGRAWLMIGHVSLVPSPHDYFHTYMGEDPVILTRDGNGKLHALLNMCRHRGNRVLRFDDGNAESFMCTYHGWTYRSDGSLESVPGEDEAYYNELDKDAMRLVEARVDTYAGIVFACWDKEAPSLEEYLGDARWYLDTYFNRRDCGMVAIGPAKWIEPVNWKTPVDNCSDNYHLPVSHISNNIVQHRLLGRPRLTQEMNFANPSKHVFVNGHSVTFRESEDNTPRFTHGMSAETFQAYVDFYRETLPEVERRLGAYRANKVQLANHSIFPNGVLWFRLALPRGPLKTEFWHFAMYEADAPALIRDGNRIGSQANLGPAGLNEQDDIDNWRNVTDSGRAPMSRRSPHNLSMGVGHEGTDERFPGIISERYISENNQRHYYDRWEEFMNARSWADIRIEPSAATYEGDAGMG